MRHDTKNAALLLAPYRERIDDIDDRIVALLVERFDVVREVAALKKREGIPVVIPDRVEAVKERNALRAEALGVDGGLVRELYDMIIRRACVLEEEIIDD